MKNSYKSLIFFIILSGLVYNIMTYEAPDYSVNLYEIKSGFPDLMFEITEGLRQPDDVQDSLRPEGYTYLSYYYNSPTEEEIDQIISNIDASQKWHRVDIIRNSENIFRNYCYGILVLELSRFAYVKKSFSFNYEKGHEILMVDIFYNRRNRCQQD